MPDNHTIATNNYRIPSKKEFKRCKDQVQAKLDYIKGIILNRDTYNEKDTRPAPFPQWIDKVLRLLIFYLVEKHPSTVMRGALYADSKCNVCATCEKVCPADRIAIVGGKPIFDWPAY